VPGPWPAGWRTTEGTTEAERSLAPRRRAEAVRRYLSDKGIRWNRVAADGYGESYPVTSNAASAGRQRNRRVEIVILEPGQDPSERKLAPVSSPPPEITE
jgi:hypothetical protein